ncbi:MAG TPA: hypothetical protein VH915_08470 [Pedococcus sp.]
MTGHDPTAGQAPGHPPALPRWRVVAVALVAAVAVVGTATHLAAARRVQQEAARTAPAPQLVPLAEVSGVPRIVFVNTAPGDHQGRVAMVRRDAPGGGRAVTDLECERVYAVPGHTVCLDWTPAGVARARVHPEGAEPTALRFTGTPSRARLSPDGALAATTSFVSGDSYAADSFSTRTVVTRLGDGPGLDLESFRLVHRGSAVRPPDRNFWGVTFAADGDTFYVTVAFDGRTWLSRGSLRERSVTTMRADAECPSISPDGRRVAYKKQGDRVPGDWRLAVLDLATGTETVLAEQRSVDDQVEWLDDDRVLYALPRDSGGPVLDSDVWVAAADGSGAPRVLVRDAASPAVVRR